MFFFSKINPITCTYPRKPSTTLPRKSADRTQSVLRRVERRRASHFATRFLSDRESEKLVESSNRKVPWSVSQGFISLTAFTTQMTEVLISPWKLCCQHKSAYAPFLAERPEPLIKACSVAVHAENDRSHLCRNWHTQLRILEKWMRVV